MDFKILGRSIRSKRFIICEETAIKVLSLEPVVVRGVVRKLGIIVRETNEYLDELSGN